MAELLTFVLTVVTTSAVVTGLLGLVIALLRKVDAKRKGVYATKDDYAKRGAAV